MESVGIAVNFDGFFRNRSVFITGHTGFKGSWLAVWLHHLGAKVTGYSLAPPTVPSNFVASRVDDLLVRHSVGDVLDAARLHGALEASHPEVIFHLAAQPLVRESFAGPRHTFEVNVMGTVNLLECVRKLDRRSVVIVVTSDKCYDNSGPAMPHRETDALGGRDPYSASKSAAEMVTAAYRHSFFAPGGRACHGVQVASVRAGNVIGGGDWAADRIVPDVARALIASRPVQVRNPGAVRPWQHVLEPLSGYLGLARRMLSTSDPELSSAWNFGPQPGDEITVRELVEEFCRAWGGGRWHEISRDGAPREDQALRLSAEKARSILGWQTHWTVRESLERAARWYRAFYARPGHSAHGLCVRDIEEYEQAIDAHAGEPAPVMAGAGNDAAAAGSAQMVRGSV